MSNRVVELTNDSRDVFSTALKVTDGELASWERREPVGRHRREYLRTASNGHFP